MWYNIFRLNKDSYVIFNPYQKRMLFQYLFHSEVELLKNIRQDFLHGAVGLNHNAFFDYRYLKITVSKT